jgi:hypothetical protein
VSTASVVTSYRALFAEPVLRRLAVADAFSRLPQGMVSITVLLVAAEHASMAVAGLAALFGQAAGVAPPGGGTETQAWLNSIMNGGAAGGAALAGLASGAPVLALGLSCALAAAAATCATVGTRDSEARADPVR